MNTFLGEPYFASLALLLLRTVNFQDEDLSEGFSNFSKHTRTEGGGSVVKLGAIQV